jgi:hypothetical protein
VLDLSLVVEGRGNGFVLKVHLVEAHAARGRLQCRLSLRVARRIVVDEEHRPAQHGVPDRPGSLRLRLRLQVAQVAGDDVDVLHAAASADVGGLVGERGAEDAFHRAHQATVDAVDVGGHCGAAEGARRAVRLGSFDEVEDGRRHRAVAGLQLDELHACAIDGSRDGGVRGAEIDRAIHGLGIDPSRSAWKNTGARL